MKTKRQIAQETSDRLLDLIVKAENEGLTTKEEQEVARLSEDYNCEDLVRFND